MEHQDPHLQLLIDMSKELAVNTAATQSLSSHIKELNGKVATQAKQISNINKILLVLGAVSGTLVATNGTDLVSFVMKIIT